MTNVEGSTLPPNLCCREEKNLGSVESYPSGLTFRRCQVCGCRHFALVAEAGVIGTRMS